jgi:hypothetical protein
MTDIELVMLGFMLGAVAMGLVLVVRKLSEEGRQRKKKALEDKEWLSFCGGCGQVKVDGKECPICKSGVSQG